MNLLVNRIASQLPVFLAAAPAGGCRFRVALVQVGQDFARLEWLRAVTRTDAEHFVVIAAQEDGLRRRQALDDEHRFVVEDIQRRLGLAEVTIDPQAATRVMRLPGLQHLYTPMGGTAPVGTNVLDMVGALHPTPAVAGSPGGAAESWIGRHEPIERGWYAGPVGYCDLAGNGEFRVGLRSVLLESGRSTLIAGAGIVAGSIPERELEETGLKLGALLGSLLGS